MKGRRADERGAATLFVLGLAIALFALAGLVIDGGSAINARQRVADDTEQAARAGAQHLATASLRDGGAVRIAAPEAAVAASDYLVARGYPASGVHVSVTGDQVTASASQRVPTVLLSIIFVNSFTVSASAQVRAEVGITGEIP